MDALVSHLVILGRFLGKYPLERWIIWRLWSWAHRFPYKCLQFHTSHGHQHGGNLICISLWRQLKTKSIFCRSIRQARSNRTAGRPKYKSVELNWFIRRTFHVPNLIIRFGTWKVRHMNFFVLFFFFNYPTPPPKVKCSNPIYKNKNYLTWC